LRDTASGEEIHFPLQYSDGFKFPFCSLDNYYLPEITATRPPSIFYRLNLIRPTARRGNQDSAVECGVRRESVDQMVWRLGQRELREPGGD